MGLHAVKRKQNPRHKSSGASPKKGAARRSWRPNLGPDPMERGGLLVSTLHGPRLQRCACGGNCPRCKGGTTGGVKIGEPGDRYEKEADRVADRILRVPRGQVQRRARGGSSGTARATSTTSALGALRGGGRPLSRSARSFFEPRFGIDLGGVRVHTGARAAAAVRSVDARAFTLGRDIVFGTGEYSMASTAGRRLLAHELTHVVQQGAAAGAESLGVTAASPAVQRQMTDAVFEATMGVGPAIAAGNMVADAGYNGVSVTASNCLSVPGCNVQFDYGKGYRGDYDLHNNPARTVRGVYVKITATPTGACGTCPTVHLIQSARNVTQSSPGSFDVTAPIGATRQTRAGTGDPDAPSQGSFLDTTAAATDPFVTQLAHTANPGSPGSPAEFWDPPGFWQADRNVGREFETCAVCVPAAGRNTIIACTQWGHYTNAAGAVSFRPAAPTASCAPSVATIDAINRWNALPGNTSANIDFGSGDMPAQIDPHQSVLWFDNNSTNLRVDASVDGNALYAAVLARVQAHFAANAGNTVVLHGFSSTDGDAAQNMTLSRNRAEAIQARLVADGVANARIFVQQHGEDSSFAGAWNRRVEVQFRTP